MIRYTFLLLILPVLLVCGIGCTAANQELATKSMEESEIRVYEVFGMDCPGCHGGLEKLVKKIPAVQKAEANWLKKQVVITVRPGTELNDEDIYDAIRRANFTPGNRLK
jgi:copper chaperone CopZ